MYIKGLYCEKDWKYQSVIINKNTKTKPKNQPTNKQTRKKEINEIQIKHTHISSFIAEIAAFLRKKIQKVTN